MDEDILKWFRAQSADVQVSLPERMPGEPDVSPEQVAELGRLSHAADADRVATLGTWQAAYLIQRLREEQRDLETRATSTALEMQARRDNRGCLWVILVIVAIALVMWFLR